MACTSASDRRRFLSYVYEPVEGLILLLKLLTFAALGLTIKTSSYSRLNASSFCRSFLHLHSLEELFLHVHLNFAVTGREGNASQDKSIADLVVVQKGSFGLIDSSRKDLSGAGTAGTRTATVRQINASLFGSIHNEHVVGTLNGSIKVVFLGNELDRISERRGRRGQGSWAEDGGKSFHGGGSDKKGKQSLGEHGGGCCRCYCCRSKIMRGV
jgi:hypothetical protein